MSNTIVMDRSVLSLRPEKKARGVARLLSLCLLVMRTTIKGDLEKIVTSHPRDHQKDPVSLRPLMFLMKLERG
ncbi:UNVERIFIED_CONTAM: hypothetical protein Sangu_2241700 [Sesamum angustifolium]|uniref:Uncharacterized protein n=1 Tax=Sesamum angustifolium TaxID=2727405 RepID=A0AAW2L7A9_9LAMI